MPSVPVKAPLARVSRQARLSISLISNGGTLVLCVVPLLALRLLQQALPGLVQSEVVLSMFYLGCGALPVVVLATSAIVGLPPPQASIYEQHLGDAADPRRPSAWLAEQRGVLQAQLIERLRALALEGYRAAPRVEDWPALVRDPRVAETPGAAQLLGLGLTLARIEQTLTPRAARSGWRRLHGELWRRLQVLPPAPALPAAQPHPTEA